MANDVEIRIRAKDDTAQGLNSVRKRMESAGNDMAKNTATVGQRMRRTLGDAGGDGAQEFGMSFAQRIGPLLAKAPVSPPLIGLVAAASPAIAAVLSGAVLTGLAGGAVAIGVKAAFNDPRVQAEGESFAAEMRQLLADSTQAFVPATIAGIKVVRGEIRKIGPELRKAGDAGAAFVLPLTRGVTSLVTEAIPGIVDGLEEAGPVVYSLERGLGQVGEAAGDAIDVIGDGASGAGLAIADMLLLASQGVRSVGVAVSALTKIYTLARVATAVDKTAVLSEMAAGQAAAAGYEAELRELIDGLTGTGSAASATAREVQTLAERTRELADANRDAYGTEISFEEAIDAAGRAAKENGKNLDLSTEAGRDNMQALIDLRDQTLGHAEDILEATNSQDQANAAMKRGYDAFINAAIAMGKTAEEARQLAGDMGLIPTQKTISIKYPTMTAAEIKARALKAGIDSIDTYKEITIVQRLQVKGVRIAGVTGVGGFTESAEGGEVTGGIRGRDSVPHMLMPGEYIIKSRVAQRPGVKPFLRALNDEAPLGGMLGSLASGDGGSGLLGRRPFPTSAPARAAEELRLVLDLTGADEEFKKMFRKWVRVDGGGSVQAAFGRPA